MIGDLLLAVKADNGNYRLVFDAGAGFVVYKAFKFNDLWTVKYWSGCSLESTASRWKTTQPFTPDDWMIERAKKRVCAAMLALTDLPLYWGV